MARELTPVIKAIIEKSRLKSTVKKAADADLLWPFIPDDWTITEELARLSGLSRKRITKCISVLCNQGRVLFQKEKGFPTEYKRAVFAKIQF